MHAYKSHDDRYYPTSLQPKGITLTARQSIAKGGGGGAEAAAMAQKPKSEFTACADGRGLGEPTECFTLINATNRREERVSQYGIHIPFSPMNADICVCMCMQAQVCYGATISIRCGWAKEKFLGIQKDGEEVGFFRNLIGTNEKWMVARPDIIRSSRATGMAGMYVCMHVAS